MKSRDSEGLEPGLPLLVLSRCRDRDAVSYGIYHPEEKIFFVVMKRAPSATHSEDAQTIDAAFRRIYHLN